MGKTKYNFSLEADLLNEVRRIANRDRRSVASILQEALEDVVKKLDERAAKLAREEKNA